MKASEQLLPMGAIFDDCGQWEHPKVKQYFDSILGDAEYLTNEQWDEFKKHFSIQTVTFWLSACVSSDDFDQIMDDCDLSKWSINEPNGFFLISMYFTEEDAQAVFAREIREDSEIT